MIMGLFGGTVFPLAMGVASDAIGAEWRCGGDDCRSYLFVDVYLENKEMILIVNSK